MALTALVFAGLAVATAPMEDDRKREGAASDATHPAIVPAGPDPAYPAEFYAPFQPQTALDMLERTPGFILAEGQGVRGFGGAAGNVLIDGQRPTVKAGGVTEVLRRISASRVERIQLLRGAETAEAQGQTLVANVILRADAGGSGNASATLSRTMDGRISPAARISHARRIAGWQTSVELSGEIVRYPSEGTHLDRDADGSLQGTRLERSSAKAPEYGLALSTFGPLAAGALTVNLRLNGGGYVSDSTIDIFDGPAQGDPAAIRTIAYEENSRNAELGLDWTRGLGSDWTAKLVALGRVERGTTDEDYAETIYRGISALDQKPTEAVGRITLAREGNRAIRPELGGELAYNRLVSHLDYAEDTGAGLQQVALSNADTRVAELRGEVFANITLGVAPRLNVESGLAFEMSRIRVTGDVASEQSLHYWKPSLALVWSASSATQLRVGARRTVDQLDFGDFAASVDQADGRPLGGNAELRPARVTRAIARIDHRWGRSGALAVEAYHQWHAGMLGYLLLPSGDEALGTIGNARTWGVTAQATIPLDAMLRNARLTVDGFVRASDIRDRLTDETHAMDGLEPRWVTAEFRHDVPEQRLSWGVNMETASDEEIYYNREILTARSGTTWGAYLETTRVRSFKITFAASAFNGARTYRMRRFYTPSRAGVASGSEERRIRSGAVFSVNLARAL